MKVLLLVRFFRIRRKNTPCNRENRQNSFSNFEELLLLFLFLVRLTMSLENAFQAKLIKELKVIFPGAIVTKLDANHIQGIPDLLILYKDKWAVLECKKSAHEKFQPNQPYYLEKMNEMSFASVIFPENKEEVLNGLQSALRADRPACVPRSK